MLQTEIKTKDTKGHQSEHVLCALVVINIASNNMRDISWEFTKQTHRQTKLLGFGTEIEYAQSAKKSEEGALGKIALIEILPLQFCTIHNLTENGKSIIYLSLGPNICF